MKRLWTGCTILLWSVALMGCTAIGRATGSETHAAVEAPKGEGLERLEGGNRRFVTGTLARKNLRQDRLDTAKEQHPYAIILSCSDSRVPPELVFDESIGKLFVVRVAGNVIDPVALGSIEYAAEHLHASLLYVMGHTACGAVKATVAGGDVPPNIGWIVERIAPSVQRVRRPHIDEHELLNSAIAENVLSQMRSALSRSEILRSLQKEGKLKVAGGIYDLESGHVTTLPVTVGAPSESTEVPASAPKH